MSDIAEQIQAAISVPVSVKIYAVEALPAMAGCPATDAYTAVDLYSNGDKGNTVVTKHKMSDDVEAIVATHLAARDPKAQKKSRQIAERVHRELYTGGYSRSRR